MGFFDQIWNGIKSVATTGYDDVKGFVSGIGNFAGGVVTRAQNTVQTAVSGVVSIGTKAVDTVGTLGGQAITTAGQVSNTFGSTLSSLGSSLSMPLLLAGGAVLIFMLMRR
jgi:phage-related protein